MVRKYKFRFFSTVSDRGQIFIPKVLQDYFNIHRRDKVEFLITDEGVVIFKKKGEEE